MTATAALTESQTKILAEIAERDADYEPTTFTRSDLRAARTLAKQGLLAERGTTGRFDLTHAGGDAYDALPAQFWTNRTPPAAGTLAGTTRRALTRYTPTQATERHTAFAAAERPNRTPPPVKIPPAERAAYAQAGTPVVVDHRAVGEGDQVTYADGSHPALVIRSDIFGPVTVRYLNPGPGQPTGRRFTDTELEDGILILVPRDGDATDETRWSDVGEHSCPSCAQWVPLDGSGLIRPHRRSDALGRAWCHGEGKEPFRHQTFFAWAIDQSTDGGRTWHWNQNTVTNWSAVRASSAYDVAAWAARRFRIDDDRTRITRIRVWPWTTDESPTFEQIKTLAAGLKPRADRSTERSPAGDGHPHAVLAELRAYERTVRRPDDGAIVAYGTCGRCLQPVRSVYRPGLPADQQDESWKLVDEPDRPSPLRMPKKRPAHLDPAAAYVGYDDTTWPDTERVTWSDPLLTH